MRGNEREDETDRTREKGERREGNRKKRRRRIGCGGEEGRRRGNKLGHLLLFSMLSLTNSASHIYDIKLYDIKCFTPFSNFRFNTPLVCISSFLSLSVHSKRMILVTSLPSSPNPYREQQAMTPAQPGPVPDIFRPVGRADQAAFSWRSWKQDVHTRNLSFHRLPSPRATNKLHQQKHLSTSSFLATLPYALARLSQITGMRAHSKAKHRQSSTLSHWRRSSGTWMFDFWTSSHFSYQMAKYTWFWAEVVQFVGENLWNQCVVTSKRNL